MKVPKEMLPRFVPTGDGYTFVPLEDLIAKHLDTLFPGMEIIDYDVFRVTRDADFTVSDEADDLLQAVEDELRRRRFGEVVRVEVGRDMSAAIREQITEALDVDPEDVFDVPACSISATCGTSSASRAARELRDAPWTPVTQPRLQGDDSDQADVLAAMRRGDILAPPPL